MDEQEKKDNSEQEDAGEKTEDSAADSTNEAEAAEDVPAESPDGKTEDEAAADDSSEPIAEEQPAAEIEAEAAGDESSKPEAEEQPAAEEADEPAASVEEKAIAEAEAPAEESADESESEPEEEGFAEAPGITGLIGRKLGMTTYYTDDGRAVPVTAIEVGPCVVTQVKTAPRHGYEAVQVGFLTAKNLNKPMAGHLERSGGRFRHLQEFGVSDLGEFEVGQEIHVNLFETGDKVKVSGVSKGRGFAGGVRRYNFRGGPKTHGQSDRHRAPGSIGAGSSPGRVWPGTKMAGHYGSAKITERGLQVVLSDPSRNLLLLGGSVPGHKNSIVRIEKQA